MPRSSIAIIAEIAPTPTIGGMNPFQYEVMFFTFFEVAAVYVTGLSVNLVWAILIGVGIIKIYGIAGFFMHLKGDPIIYTRTAIFPLLFAALMLWGIGLSNPASIMDLPNWCTPDWDYSYVTN